jgi:hypothetical protein
MIRNKKVLQVFNELDGYRDFCRERGYVFDEKDLYRRGTPYGQYERARRGDPVTNNWVEDARQLGRTI